MCPCAVAVQSLKGISVKCFVSLAQTQLPSSRNVFSMKSVVYLIMQNAIINLFADMLFAHVDRGFSFTKHTFVLEEWLTLVLYIKVKMGSCPG